MDICEKMYYSEIQSSEIESKASIICSREKNRIKQFYKTLKNTLSDDELKTLDKLIKCEETIIASETMRLFMNGLRVGMSFSIETLN
ncbi:MAG: DUF6809 family protein [Hominilimicola sp.]